MTGKGRSFRDCVCDCARDPQIVELFNAMHGTSLSAPIDALVRHQRGAPGPKADTAQDAAIAAFILFIHYHVWRHVKRPRQRRNWPVQLSDLRSCALAESLPSQTGFSSGADYAASPTRGSGRHLTAGPLALSVFARLIV